MDNHHAKQTGRGASGFSWKRWKKRHRLLRWLPAVLLTVVIILVSAVFVVTRSSFLISFAVPILSDTSGGKVSIRRASVVGINRLVLYDVRIRVPDMPGKGGELVYLPEVRVDIDWSGVLSGEFRTKRVVVAPGALVRISEDVNHGVFNFGGLRFSKLQGKSRVVIPQIEMLRTTVEIGVLKENIYHKSGTIVFSGSLIPDKHLRGSMNSESHWYKVALHEIPDSGQSDKGDKSAIDVEGRLNPDTGEASAKISGLSFTDARSALLPQRVREWWAVLQPHGSLQPIIIKTKADGRYSVELRVDGVDWNLPLTVSSFMSHPQRADSDGALSKPLRMTDVSGTMVVNDEGAKLIGVSGVVEGVRYGLHGKFTSLNRSPGFDLTFNVNDFDLSRNTNIIAVLPESVQRVVSEQLFQVDRRSGIFNAIVHVSRSDEVDESKDRSRQSPAKGEEVDQGGRDGAIQVNGRIQFHDAAGVYKGFPYRLSGLIGEIEFDNDEVQVVSLAGRTETGGGIWIAGKVSQLGPDPEIDLKMFATEIPIDDRLKQAFDPRTAKQIDRFFNAGSTEALRRAGLIMNQEDHDALLQRILDLKKSASQNNDDESLLALKEEIDLLQNRLERIPVFRLGGLVNLTSTIKRKAGPDQPLKTTTRLKLSHRNEPIGVLYSKFPYPLRFTEGELEIAWGRIRIVKDIRMVGLTGCTVTISGNVERKRTPDYHLEEHLTIDAEPVPIDSYLVHALPGKAHDSAGGESWPGRSLTTAGRTVAGLNLDGDISVHGTVTHDADSGKAQYQFQVQLRNGSTVPFHFLEERTATAENDEGRSWDWPIDLPLHGISGDITITRHGLTIDKMSGNTTGGAEIRAAGGIDWAVGPTDIDLLFIAKGLAYQPSLIDLASGVGGVKVERSMRDFQLRFDPAGVFDSTITWKRDDDRGEQINATIVPLRGSLSFGGQRIAFNNLHGQVQLSGGDTVFKDISATMQSPTQPGESFGTLTLDGKMIADGGQRTDWRGTWSGGRFDAPFLPGILSSFGRSELAKQYQQFNAQGLFDASFGSVVDGSATVTEEEDGVNRDTPVSLISDNIALSMEPFQLTVRPVDLLFTWKKNHYDTKNYRGEATIFGDTIKFNNLIGEFQDGGFSLDGTVKYGKELKIDLDMSLSSDALNDRARAILPSVAKQTIAALGLKVGDSLQVYQAHLDYDDPSFALREHRVGADDKTSLKPLPPASIHFTGTIGLADAQMEVPVSISNMNGRIHLDISRGENDDWPNSDIRVDIDSMRAEGRLIENGIMVIRSEPKRGLLIIPSVIGNCYGGLITGTASVQLPIDDAPGHYETDIKLANIRVAPFIADTKSKLDQGKKEAGDGQPTQNINRKEGGNIGRPTEPGVSSIEDVSTINIPGTGIAHIAVSGTIGDPESKRGRGSIQVRNGQLYDVPMVMWVLQISSLAAPVATSFRDADIDFYIQGSNFVFERLELGSPTMMLGGSGNIQYPSGRIDMQFKSLSRMRAPFLSDVWEWIRDQLFSVRVTGTLDEPVTQLVPFK